ncbi:hypothetical protein SAMN05216389_10364 [Oceanobacillus limi]|uniref:Uncharacterized protein n=2 Tax=Oceanobacillus limi TaxID=930131 RepID=A0A1I0A4B8_9BACI|nr:hypothetical protein SAMN05216389_10364 [Oceanobacillus limi]
MVMNMSKVYQFGVIFLAAFSLVACMDSAQPEKRTNDSNSNPYKNLSNEPFDPNEIDIQARDLEDTDLEDENNFDNDKEIPGETSEEEVENFDPYEDADENQPQREQRSLQETLPDSSTERELEEHIPDEHDTSKETPLPIDNFKERWNAVSDEQFSELYIESLQEIETENGVTYESKLTNQLALRIHANNQGYVEQLEMVQEGTLGSNVYQMLTGWSQIINIIHPNLEINDVDSLFHDIGVGPNGDLSNVSETSFDYHHIHYHISPTENGYTFRARYN